MSLPILTAYEDVKGIVEYLKNKPTGATISEAKTAVKRQMLDGRKMSAYTSWLFIQKDGERLKLAPRGWEMARKVKSDALIFREVIDGCVPYRSVLEWAFHQNFEELTNVDVAAHWHEHHSENIGTNNDNTIKDQAVCFFRVCEVANLGSVTVGRHGQATRISLERSELQKYIEAGPATPPWPETKQNPAITDDASSNPGSSEPIPSNQTTAAKPEVSLASIELGKTSLQVFISHGKNTQLVEQVETMLGLADIKSEVAVKEETAAIPVPDKVFNAMKRCTAAIIIVSVDEGYRDAGNNYTVNENVLIEIGAAFVLYDKRVVLLWDKRLKVPSNLQGLYRCEFEGEDLNWGAGMKLMKAIKGFKN